MKEIVCPNCAWKYEMSITGLMVIWFFNLDVQKFVAKRCGSTYCRGQRR